MTFGASARKFLFSLKAPRVPKGVHVMNPYRTKPVQKYTGAFLDKFYGDSRGRTLIFGINPGRFGAGITGITFTDPIALADFCGIENHLPRRRELSSVFIYDLIASMGGTREFYSKFYLAAICPLGFTRAGINLNYYDIPALQTAVTPFIVSSIEKHIAFGGRRDRAFVLGNGKNAKYLKALNDTHGFFDNIVALEHPRFILQYRRKRVTEYIRKYSDALS